ncbi:hypothetical protein [Oscillatoria nigro-viridis]|uniref:hypothetical protein n=1 Tax=Phormidium nigroviride TaxID=482564 RepID=UPI0002DD42D0|nr:hypothetical protein [Oscillatoria nigro-viridis]
MGVRGFFWLLGAFRLSIARVFRKDKLAQLQHDTIYLDRSHLSRNPRSQDRIRARGVAIARLLKNHPLS